MNSPSVRSDELKNYQREVFSGRIAVIRDYVAREYGMPSDSLNEHTRKRTVSEPRQIIQYLTRDLMPKCPLWLIGEATGNGKAFDHTTVLHSYNLVRIRMITKNTRGNYIDPEFRDMILRMRSELIYLTDHDYQAMKKEEILHRQVVEYLKYQYPKVLFNTDLSGVLLHKGIAGKMSTLRSRKGHPDIAIYEPRNGYHALFVELKAEGVRVYRQDGQLVSDEHIREQGDYMKELGRRGFMAVFAVGFDEAKRIIDEYLGGKK